MKNMQIHHNRKIRAIPTLCAAMLAAIAAPLHSETFTESFADINGPQVVSLTMKDHDKHRGVQGSFKLGNSLIDYGVVYRACNDVVAHDETDLRRAWGQFMPGIGFNRPNVASWYYNNYIKILLDDMPVGEYIIKDIRDESADGTAKVVVTWETPKGMVDLSFALMRDHKGVFQELKVYDLKDKVDRISVELGGYYWGFGKEDKKSDGFITTDPSGHDEWALMGNKVNEPPTGTGPCALLTLPKELDGVKYGRPNSMEKTVNVAPGQSATIRWVLWMFPDLSNKKALEYMTNEAANTRERLLKLFKTKP
ncbi:MAG: hypothetical protein LC104_19850 [Bacteroidales bacterium]|nr:hypothetical protein [Bacteroidales bacterium]